MREYEIHLICRSVEEWRCGDVERRRFYCRRRWGGQRGRRRRASEVRGGRAEPGPRAHAEDDGGDGVRLHLLLDALLGHHHVVRLPEEAGSKRLCIG